TTRAGANTNSFNCEHTFPQGFFNQNEPMRSDIHHLFPTDITANGKRGNDPFGVVSNPSWQVGGSKSGGGVFEPRDVHKGTCARSMMYFVIRYQDYSNHFAGQEAILRSWHNAFPPLSAEKSRNNQIATLQTSRNPFVDYPQFEERITSFVSNSVAPSVHSLYYSDDTIRLRPSSGRYEYEFVFYNDGNETVTITNFSLSDTSLHFEPGAVLSMTIPPGWASPVRISYESSNTYLAQLTFDTDIPGQPTQVIPIRSKAGIGVEESALTGKMHIYPNPVSNMLTVAVDGDPVKEVKVYDISGVERNVLLSENHIDMSMLPAGFYLLKVRTESGEIMLEKVIKR
ncbi:MAG: endonuclease, partial [Owenweeksia sp.]